MEEIDFRRVLGISILFFDILHDISLVIQIRLSYLSFLSKYIQVKYLSINTNI